MAQRSKHSELTVRVSFEATRIASQCLAEAYGRLVPIPRRPTRRTEGRGTLVGPAVAAKPTPMRRRAEGE